MCHLVRLRWGCKEGCPSRKLVAPGVEALGDHNAQLAQFCDDAPRSPSRVGLRHPADQLPDLQGDGGTSRSSPTAQSRPVLAEAPALPCDDGGWLDEDQRVLPAGPHAGEPSPEAAVGGLEAGIGCCSLVDSQKGARRQDLQSHGEAAAEGEQEQAGEGKHGSRQRGHRFPTVE